MTRVFFVRHALPDYSIRVDKIRPLSKEGLQDTRKIVDYFKNHHIMVDGFYCSDYKRSIQTIRSTADYFHKEIIIDSRLHERVSGLNGYDEGMREKRWADRNFHEINGESINMVMNRNIEAMSEILPANDGKTIIIGTHGTALSTILAFYTPDFGYEDSERIMEWLPCIIELQFDGMKFLKKIEHMYVQK